MTNYREPDYKKQNELLMEQIASLTKQLGKRKSDFFIGGRVVDISIESGQYITTIEVYSSRENIELLYNYGFLHRTWLWLRTFLFGSKTFYIKKKSGHPSDVYQVGDNVVLELFKMVQS